MLHALMPFNGNTLRVFTVCLTIIFLALLANSALKVDNAPMIDFAGESRSPAHTPTERDVAVGVCQDHKTSISFITTTNGSFYEATFDSPKVRYDLTWQVGGTTVAVESLQGSREEIWAEQIGEDFWSCVRDRAPDIKQKVVAH